MVIIIASRAATIIVFAGLIVLFYVIIVGSTTNSGEAHSLYVGGKGWLVEHGVPGPWIDTYASNSIQAWDYGSILIQQSANAAFKLVVQMIGSI